jgi:BNR repeat protein
MFTLTISILAAVVAQAVGDAPFHTAELIFEPNAELHGHAHASCIVECPNGDLLAVWYENGKPLPERYFKAQGDKSDDVRIGGCRWVKGEDGWGEPFIMADTFGASDNNPCMVIDDEERLWLIYPTLLGVPEDTWGSSLVRYHVSSDYEGTGLPRWEYVNVLPIRPRGFEEVLENTARLAADHGDMSLERTKKLVDRALGRLKDPFDRRLGWMPRAHPLIRSDGALVLPLSNENFGIAAMAITQDTGRTWTISEPVPQAGVTQPTLVEFKDGQIAAFFRNGFPEQRIVRSESRDGGMTWSDLETTDLPHPGAGIEALLLDDGRLLMIYNDTTEERDSLAVSISDDRGKTWKWTRHLEREAGGRFDYPSILQAADGTLHATYSVNVRTIRHAHFNVAWVMVGDS